MISPASTEIYVEVDFTRCALALHIVNLMSNKGLTPLSLALHMADLYGNVLCFSLPLRGKRRGLLVRFHRSVWMRLRVWIGFLLLWQPFFSAPSLSRARQQFP